MAIEALDHITVSTADLDASRRFYVDVLGLREGDRPPFEAPGAWLYAGDSPIVHLVAERGGEGPATGAFDHLAFRASGLARVVERLEADGVAYEVHTVPGLGLKQVFVHDPDGVKIELNFAASERIPESA